MMAWHRWWCVPHCFSVRILFVPHLVFWDLVTLAVTFSLGDKVRSAVIWGQVGVKLLLLLVGTESAEVVQGPDQLSFWEETQNMLGLLWPGTAWWFIEYCHGQEGLGLPRRHVTFMSKLFLMDGRQTFKGNRQITTSLFQVFLWVLKVSMNSISLSFVPLMTGPFTDMVSRVPAEFRHVIWTRGMRRLAVLLGRALRFGESVLLVGDTG